MLCDVGEHARGLELLKRAVDKDYAAVTALAHARAFDAVRSDAPFQRSWPRPSATSSWGWPCSGRTAASGCSDAEAPDSRLRPELAQVVVGVQVAPAQPVRDAHPAEDRVRLPRQRPASLVTSSSSARACARSAANATGRVPPRSWSVSGLVGIPFLHGIGA